MQVVIKQWHKGLLNRKIKVLKNLWNAGNRLLKLQLSKQLETKPFVSFRNLKNNTKLSIKKMEI